MFAAAKPVSDIPHENHVEGDARRRIQEEPTTQGGRHPRGSSMDKEAASFALCYG